MNYLLVILGVLTGIIIGYFLFRKAKGGFDKHNAAKRQRVEEAKERIMKMLDNQEKITNDDVEELLGVGNTTAYRYLEALEKEGKLVQEGKTGRFVTYRKS